jgi:hypothetical protein
MLVFMEDSAESISSMDLQVPDPTWFGDGFGQWAERSRLTQRPVRPMAIVEGFELAQRMQEVAFIPDQGAIQQLAPAGPYPALHDGVHPRHPDAAGDDLQPGIG